MKEIFVSIISGSQSDEAVYQKAIEVLQQEKIPHELKIISAHRTGTCAWHQRKLTQEIKRARQVALLAFTHK